MRVVDTSVVVAGFASWHEKHEAARRVLDQDPRLVEHSALEVYSILTRLPAPHRAASRVVRDFLAARFRRPFLRMSAEADLVTCDRRAQLTYEKYGVTVVAI